MIREPMCRYVSQSAGRTIPFFVSAETAMASAPILKQIAVMVTSNFFMECLLIDGFNIAIK
jgi:hypothetical protein